MNSAKQEAKDLIEKLPSSASWDDIFYELYVRQKISKGIKAADEGNVIVHEKVKRKFGIR